MFLDELVLQDVRQCVAIAFGGAVTASVRECDVVGSSDRTGATLDLSVLSEQPASSAKHAAPVHHQRQDPAEFPSVLNLKNIVANYLRGKRRDSTAGRRTLVPLFRRSRATVEPEP